MSHAQAKADVDAMIDASSVTISIAHKTLGTAGFYGQLESVGTGTSAKALVDPVDKTNPTLRSGDAVVSVKATVDIREGDRVTMSGQAYDVTNVDPQDLFGTITHIHATLSAVRAQ